jgi:hypothetical protein
MEKRRSNMKKDKRVGTWNVLPAQRRGALQNLIHVTQKYKTGLLAVQEVKWLGRGITEKKDYKI